MAAPFISELLGRRSGQVGAPNVSDSGSRISTVIGDKLLELLELPRPGFVQSHSPGDKLERAVADHLRSALAELSPDESWEVKHSDNDLTGFAQYRHLEDLAEAIRQDESGSLRIVVGGDYLVKPDVTVARRRDSGPPVLHASVSCKWTLRSDRAQNARTEARGLLRHRKGRAPHIVVVIAEPLPSRLASLGLGTGDFDAIYHVCFDELLSAVEAVGSKKEKTNLDVLVRGDRLRDYNRLASVLATD